MLFEEIMNLEEKVEKKILENLGCTKEQVELWEEPSYEMDKAVVKEFWGYVSKAPAIYLLGDYDVDGIVALYIMATSIKELYPNIPIRIRLPRRFSEGYGLRRVHVDEIKKAMPKGSVVITVDNGISVGSLLKELEDSGYTVLLTDHHQLSGKIPDVTMVLNPTIEADSPFDGNYWCGAGVAYKLCEQVVSIETKNDIESFAALATIADCVTLKEGNWALVRKVLRKFRQGNYPPTLGLLASIAGQDLSFSVEDTFSYYLGPIINAPGRLDDKGASKVLRYLLTKDAPSIESAVELTTFNNKRKALRDAEVQIAKDYVYDNGLEDKCPIWIYSSDFHEGIVGIIAGKIAEEFNVPAFVLTDAPNGCFKGSARAAGDFNVIEYLKSISSYMETFGGHVGAAGLKIRKENFDIVKDIFAPFPYIKNPIEDAFLIQGYEIPIVQELLSRYSPFGEGNPEIYFKYEVNEVSQENLRTVAKDGKTHLFITAEDKSWQVSHFNHDTTSFDDPKHYVLVGTIKLTQFNGEEIPTLLATAVLPSTETKGVSDEEKEM